MPWWKGDDAMMEHPKIRALSHAAFRLHMLGNFYCARELTDGAIPIDVAEGYAFRCSRSGGGSWEALLSELTTPLEGSDNPLWHREGDAFRIHDYLQYNPSREQVLAERASGAVRVRAYRARRASADDPEGCNGVTPPATPTATNAVTNAVGSGTGNGERSAAPGPDPVPDPRNPKLAGGLGAREGARDADDELLVPDSVATALREALGRDLCRADLRRVDGWVRDGIPPSLLVDVISERAAAAKQRIRSSKWFERIVEDSAKNLRIVPLTIAKSDLLVAMDLVGSGSEFADRVRDARDADEVSELEEAWFAKRTDLPGDPNPMEATT